ncbi:MAG: MFS transporter [Anaerolineae bacterium]
MGIPLPRTRLFWSVSLGHFTVDMFSAAVAVILAFLSGHLLSMTNTEIGFALSGYQLTSAISQPLCGWIADRTGGRWLGAGGVAWTVFMILLALLAATVTHSYALMVIPLVLAALGSGAFHPVGAMHAAHAETGRMTNLSLFFFMGQLGGAVGPVLAGFLLDQTASRNALFTAALGPTFSGRLVENGSVAPLFLLGLVAIPGVALMSLVIPGAAAHRALHGHPASAGASRRLINLAPLLVLAVVILLRGLINPGLVSFLPRLFQLRGWSAAEYGLVTSMYWLGGALMGVIFGQFGDRFGSRLLIVASMLLAAPAVFGLTISDGVISFALALAVGAFSGGSHSIIVALTQKLMPTGKGLASGAALGFIFGTGALGVLVIGALADRFGLDFAFQVVAVVGVITGLLAFLLPADRPARVAVSTVVEEPLTV